MADDLTPRHPSAVRVIDEDGREVSLDLSEAQVRLACLGFVLDHRGEFDGEPLVGAANLAAFVLGGPGAAVIGRHGYDGTPESARYIAEWAGCPAGAGILLGEAGEVIEHRADGSFWRVRERTEKPLQFAPADMMDATKAANASSEDRKAVAASPIIAAGPFASAKAKPMPGSVGDLSPAGRSALNLARIQVETEVQEAVAEAQSAHQRADIAIRRAAAAHERLTGILRDLGESSRT